MKLSEKATRTLVGFAKALTPTFEKMRLHEDLNASHKKLRDLEPFYNTMGKEFAKHIQTNMRQIDQVLRQEVPGYRGNVVETIHKAIQLRIKEQNDLAEYVDGLYAGVVLRDTFDYQKLMMLRYTATISFFVDYARKLILVAANDMVNDRDIVSPVDKVDREFVEDRHNVESFGRVLAAMLRPVKDIREAFAELNKIQFDPVTHDALVRTSGRKMDPMNFGYLPVVGSLVYFMGRQWNLYLANVQEESQMEVEKLQVKLLMLRRQAEGESDPEELAKLKRQLDYYNNRLNKLNAKLERLVEEA